MLDLTVVNMFLSDHVVIFVVVDLLLKKNRLREKEDNLMKYRSY